MTSTSQFPHSRLQTKQQPPASGPDVIVRMPPPQLNHGHGLACQRYLPDQDLLLLAPPNDEQIDGESVINRSLSVQWAPTSPASG